MSALELGPARVERTARGYAARLGSDVIASSDDAPSFARLLALDAPADALAQAALWWWPGRAPGALVEGAFPTSPRGWRAPLTGEPDPRVVRRDGARVLELYAFEPHALRLYRVCVMARGDAVEFSAEELTAP